MVRRLKTTLVLTVLIIVGGMTGLAQPKSADEREAEELARRFYRRFQQTKDIGPLIHRFFADDFLERLLQNTEPDPLLLVRKDVAVTASRDQLRRYLVAQINWLHLFSLYSMNKYGSGSDELSGLNVAQLHPADVWRVLRRNPLISAWLTNNLSNEDLITTVAKMTGVAQSLEQAVVLLRNHVRAFGRKPTKRYLSTLADWRERFHLYDAWETECDEDCFGLPPKSKFIRVNVPTFQLVLIGISGKMKIISIMPYGD